jgi:hypothetical protein
VKHNKTYAHQMSKIEKRIAKRRVKAELRRVRAGKDDEMVSTTRERKWQRPWWLW